MRDCLGRLKLVQHLPILLTKFELRLGPEQLQKHCRADPTEVEVKLFKNLVEAVE